MHVHIWGDNLVIETELERLLRQIEDEQLPGEVEPDSRTSITFAEQHGAPLIWGDHEWCLSVWNTDEKTAEQLEAACKTCPAVRAFTVEREAGTATP